MARLKTKKKATAGSLAGLRQKSESPRARSLDEENKEEKEENASSRERERERENENGGKSEGKIYIRGVESRSRGENDRASSRERNSRRERASEALYSERRKQVEGELLSLSPSRIYLYIYSARASKRGGEEATSTRASEGVRGSSD